MFGTERSGLTNEEVMLCQGCAAIQADPESPSLNLAQAVQITAYEMHMALMTAEGHAEDLYDWQSRFEHEQPATVEAIEGFFGHWEKAMEACGVHDPKNPKNLMPITRRLFGRSGLTQTEIDLLRGICSAIIRPKRDRAGEKKPKSRPIKCVFLRGHSPGRSFEYLFGLASAGSVPLPTETKSKARRRLSFLPKYFFSR
ncbi:tRNA/rRNA methyltransferase [gut metagenome]|uniref:tRNA/rRNA methyltransferase n=1 Tax=gut metagenome TaxID=749906 RepID=J9CSJ6_9ZZZZ